MPRARRRIRDLVRPKSDHPDIAARIDRDGWVPEILCDVNGANWDTRAVRDRRGKRIGGISDGESKRMIQLILDGEFGEEAKDAYVDGEQYWKIHDNLFRWPNQEIITREGLRLMVLTRKT